MRYSAVSGMQICIMWYSAVSGMQMLRYMCLE